MPGVALVWAAAVHWGFLWRGNPWSKAGEVIATILFLSDFTKQLLPFQGWWEKETSCCFVFFFSFSFSFYVQGEQHAKKKKQNPSGVIYVVLNAQCQSKGFEPKYLACLSLLWLQGLPFICWIDLAVIVTRMGILWSFFVLWDKVTSSRSLKEGGAG